MSGRVGSITTEIIADGLVFNMDAANRASTIPSTSTTKTFNTVTNKSGSLSTSGMYDDSINSPSFASDADASILTEEEFGWGAIEDFTINFFNYADYGTGPGANYNIYCTTTNSSWQWYQYQRKFTIYITGANGGGANSNIGYPNHLSSIQNYDTWYYTSLTRKSSSWVVYYNGVLDHSYGSDSNAAATPGKLYLMRDAANSIGYNGNLACISIYNRALSANEVLHNYNALKERFGL